MNNLQSSNPLFLVQVPGLSFVRNGGTAVPVLRRQDEPLLALQEDRTVRLPASAVRQILGRTERSGQYKNWQT